MQGRGRHAGRIGARRQIGGRSIIDKIDQALGRSDRPAAALAKGSLFKGQLIVQTRQGPTRCQHGDVRQLQLHDDGGIGEGGIAFGKGHAVDHQGIVPGGCRYDIASRTHAETVDTTALHLLDKTVGGRRQKFASRLAMVLDPVDQPLGMLHAHAHGKGLGFQGNLLGQQHFINIPGTVPGGQDHGAPMDAPPILEYHTGDATLIDRQPHDLLPKTNFAAMGLDGGPHGRDNGRQAVGADVGLCIV